MSKTQIISVKIFNHKWSVRFIDPDKMREGDIGTCWSYKRAIDIDNTLTYEEAKTILLHELTHAFLASCGDLHQDQYKEEKVCDFVAWNADEMIAVRDNVLKAVFK